MTSDVHRAVHEVAPRPSEPAPFDRLWTRGRRRRAIVRTSGALAGLAVIGLAAAVLPGVLSGDDGGIGLEVADQPTAGCPITDADHDGDLTTC